MKCFCGKVIAIIHRLNMSGDKLILVPNDKDYNDDQIGAMVKFQERFFSYEIIR